MAVYLIHFEKPIGNTGNVRGQAQHYIGFSENPTSRLETHRSGEGAAILRFCNEHEIHYDIVRVWEGDRAFERKLKNQKKARRLCPVCNCEH